MEVAGFKAPLPYKPRKNNEAAFSCGDNICSASTIINERGQGVGCCNPPKILPEQECPACGSPGKSVKRKTIKHHVVARFVPSVPELPFYFCETGGCGVVYFSEDGSVRYATKDLRSPVGIKESSVTATACYCFGITADMIGRETGRSSFSTWVAIEVKLGNCACDVRNPSGRCCLKELKTVEASAGDKKLVTQGGKR